MKKVNFRPEEVPEWIKTIASHLAEETIRLSKELISLFDKYSNSKNADQAQVWYDKIRNTVAMSKSNVQLLRFMGYTITPALIMGVEKWIYSDPSRKPVNMKRELEQKISAIIEILSILYSHKDLDHPIKNLESLLEQVKPLKIMASKMA